MLVRPIAVPVAPVIDGPLRGGSLPWDGAGGGSSDWGPRGGSLDLGRTLSGATRARPAYDDAAEAGPVEDA